MKNVLIGFILSTVILSIFSFTTKENSPICEDEGLVKWYTWEEAVEASKKKKKKVFVDIYTDWCGWCKRMDKNTFENPKVAKYLNEHYYPIKFNAEQKEEITYAGHTFKFVNSGRRGYHQLAAALLNGKMSYPTVVFLNEDFEIMQRIPGFRDVDEFSMIMTYLAEWHKKISWAQFQKDYEKN